MNDNAKWIYDALSKKGVNLGTYEQFSEGIKDEASRKWVYDIAGKKGLNLGTYEQMDSALAVNPVAETQNGGTSAATAAAPADGGNGGTTRRAVEGGGTSATAEEQQFVADPGPQQEVAVPDTNEERLATAYGYGTLQRQKIKDDIAKQKAEEKKKKKKKESNAIKDFYENNGGKEQLKSMEETANKQVEENKSAFQKGLDSMSEVLPGTKIINSLTDIVKRWTDDSYGAARTTQQKIQETKDMLDEASHVDNGFADRQLLGLTRGLFNSAGNIRTWDLGVNDLTDVVNINATLNKYENGEDLTPEEEGMLDALAFTEALQSAYGEDVGMGYRIGQSVPQSAGFAASIYLNPANIATRVATKGAVNTAGEAIAKKLFKRYAKRKYGLLGMKAIGGASRIGGDAVEAIATTFTTGMPRTLENIEERMAGQALGEVGEDGTYKYVTSAEREDTWDALLKGSASAFFENESEMIGEYFGPMLQPVKNMMKAASKSKGWRGDVVRWLVNAPDSDVDAMMKNFKGKVHINGLFGEYAEEVINNVASVSIGDMNFSMDPNSEDWKKSVFNFETNLETFLSCAAMLGPMKAVEYGGRGINYYNATKQLNNAEKRMDAVYGKDNDNGKAIREEFLNAGGIEEMSKVFGNLLDRRMIANKQEAQAVTDWLSKLVEQQTVNSRYTAKKAGTNHLENVGEDAYNAGMSMKPETYRQANAELDKAVADATQTFGQDTADAILSNNPWEMNNLMMLMNEQQKKIAGALYYNRKRMEGIMDSAELAASTVVDQFKQDVKYCVQEQDGKKTYQTATYEEPGKEPVEVYIYPTSVIGVTSVVIPVGGGQMMAVNPKYLNNQTEHDYDQEVEARTKATKEEAGNNVNWAFSHNMNTKMPVVPTAPGQGMIVPSGMGEGGQQNRVYVTDVDYENGLVYTVPTTYDTATGTEVPVNGQAPQAMTIGEFLQMQDDFYDAVEMANTETADGGTSAPTAGAAADGGATSSAVEVLGGTEVGREAMQQVDDWMSAGEDAETINSLIGSSIDPSVQEMARQYYQEKAAEAQNGGTSAPTGGVAVDGATSSTAQDGGTSAPTAGTAAAPAEGGTTSGAEEEGGSGMRDGDGDLDPDLMVATGDVKKVAAALRGDHTDEAANIAGQLQVLAQEEADKEKSPIKKAKKMKAVAFWGDVMKELQPIDEGGQQTAAELRKEQASKIREEAEKESHVITDRWDSAPKEWGRNDVYVAPNGQKVTGKFCLTEDGAFTPSHDPHTFQPNKGFPVTEQGKTANSTDYSREENKNMVRLIGSKLDGRALQDWVIVLIGRVLSGNNRTMSGQLAAENNTDSEYIDMLKIKAEGFGFTKEQVGKFTHPRLVFVADEDQGLDFSPATFAIFNAERGKGESATEQAIKFGKVLDDKTFKALVDIISGRNRLSDLYKSNEDCKKVADVLENAGVMSRATRVNFIDASGLLTEAGKQALESALIGKVFSENENAVRQLSEMPAVRKRVIEAIKEITVNRTMGDYSLDNELGDAISLVNEAVKSGMGLKSFYQQTDFTRDIQGLYNASVYCVADMLNGTSGKSLKELLQSYNRDAAAQVAGDSLFGAKTREELLEEILNALGYELKTKRSATGRTSGEADTATQGNDEEVTAEDGATSSTAQEEGGTSAPTAAAPADGNNGGTTRRAVEGGGTSAPNAETSEGTENGMTKLNLNEKDAAKLAELRAKLKARLYNTVAGYGEKGIQVSEAEYSKISSIIATNQKKSPTQYIFTDNNFYICTGINHNTHDFVIMTALPIAGNEDLINDYRGKNSAIEEAALTGEGFADLLAEIRSRGGRVSGNYDNANQISQRGAEGGLSSVDGGGTSDSGTGKRKDSNGRFNSGGLRRPEVIAREIGVEVNGEYGASELERIFNDYNTNAVNRRLAEKVFPVLKMFGTKVKFLPKGMAKDGRTLIGAYIANDNTIELDLRFISGNMNEVAATMLHEAIHALTFHAIGLYKAGTALPNGVKEACAEIMKIYDIIKRDPKLQGAYGIESAEEMLAELARPSFRERLKKIGVFRKIIDAVARIIGINTKDANTNVYEVLSEDLNTLLDNFTPELYNKWVEMNNEGKLDEIYDGVAGYGTSDVFEFDSETYTIGVETAQYYVKGGVSDFSDFANAMMNDFGDAIRPYIKSIYEGCRMLPTMFDYADKMTSHDEVAKFDSAKIGNILPDVIPDAEASVGEKEVEENGTDAGVYGENNVPLQGEKSPWEQTIEKCDGILNGTKDIHDLMPDEVTMLRTAIDNSDLSDRIKTNANYYLDGNTGNTVAQMSFAMAIQNVRNQSQPSTGNSDDANGAFVGSETDGSANGESGPSRGEDGKLADGGNGEDVSEGQPESVENDTSDDDTPIGEEGNNDVPERPQPESPVRGTDGKQPKARSSVRGKRNSGNGRGGDKSGGTSSVDAGAGSADPKSRRASALERLKAARDKYKNAGKGDGTLSVSIMPFGPKNIEQMEAAMEMLEASTEIGYSYLEEGVYKFKEWTGRMVAEIGDMIKDAFGYKEDVELNRYIQDLWDSPFEIDGETKLISEWAATMENAALRAALKVSLAEKKKAQEAAEKVQVKFMDIDNIRETLPFLLPDQQEDVLKAETQFLSPLHSDKEHGYGKGYMFTNGTGTGKTYTGLGIVKRFIKTGSKRILIVTPSAQKVKDWCDDAVNLGIDLKSLDDIAKKNKAEKGKDGAETTATTAKGTGAVITTYANMGQNDALLEDDFDLVVYDESHRLMQSWQGTVTSYYKRHVMLTNKNYDTALNRIKETLPETKQLKEVESEIADIEKEYESSWGMPYETRVRYEALRQQKDKLNDAIEAEMPKHTERAKEAALRTKTVFLSATPFNTPLNLHYAEGYIFSYPGEYSAEDPDNLSNRGDFLATNFGATYKKGGNGGVVLKCNRNEDDANSQEVQFADKLMSELCTMSTRTLKNGYDYSRDFPTLDVKMSGKFNEAVETLNNDNDFKNIRHYFPFNDYNTMSVLFETMKISASVERIKEHLKMGRKVVVFHRRVNDRNHLAQAPFAKGLTTAEFTAEMLSRSKYGYDRELAQKMYDEIAKFRSKFSDLLIWESKLDYRMPRQQLEALFGNKDLQYTEEQMQELNGILDELNAISEKKKPTEQECYEGGVKLGKFIKTYEEAMDTLDGFDFGEPTFIPEGTPEYKREQIKERDKERYDVLRERAKEGAAAALAERGIKEKTRAEKQKDRTIGFFSGVDSKGQKMADVKTFQDDDSKMNVIVIQEESGKEGISLHDVTSKHPRVLMSLALPQSPITFIQIEGRIFRIGQQSNAIFEYPLLGINQELQMFSQRFNSKAGTTENLAFGSSARALRQSLAKGIFDHSGVIPLASQGVGGIEYDNQTTSQSNFDSSIKDYYTAKRQFEGSVKSQKQTATPCPLAYKMVEWLMLKPGEKVLEPGAGYGAISKYFPMDVRSLSIETNTARYAQLSLWAGGIERGTKEANGKARLLSKESFNDLSASGNKFDAVVMNPEFGEKGMLAYQTLYKAWQHLNDSGRLITILPDTEETEKQLKDFMETNGDVIPIATMKLPKMIDSSEEEGEIPTKLFVFDRISRKEFREQMENTDVKEADLSKFDKIEDFFAAIRKFNLPERTKDPYADAVRNIELAKLQLADNALVKGKKGNKENSLWLYKNTLYVDLTDAFRSVADFPYSFDVRKLIKPDKAYAKRYVDWTNLLKGSDKDVRDGVISYYYDYTDKNNAAIRQLVEVSCDLIRGCSGITDDQLRRLADGENIYDRNAVKLGEYLTFEQLRQKFEDTNHGNAAQQELFDRVYEQAAKLGFHVGTYNNPRSRAGAYFAYGARPELRINRAAWNAENATDEWRSRTIIHEMIHGVSTYAMFRYESNPSDPMLSENIREACRLIKEVYDYIMESPEGFVIKGQYGLTNYYEILAELSNPDFVSKLKLIGHWERVKDGVKKTYELSKYDDSDAEDFGLTKYDVGTPAQLALDLFLSNLDVELFNNTKASRNADWDDGTVDEDTDNANESRFRKGEVVRTHTAEEMAEMEKAALMGPNEFNVPVVVLRTAEEVDKTKMSAQDKSTMKREGKGLYDMDTDQVYVFLPNCEDAEDVRVTILHEMVGHKGLRKMFGKDKFDKAMMALYAQLPKSERDKVVLAAERKYDYNVAEAMDEYLAEIAEKDETPTWWDKVRSMFRNLLRNMGLSVELTDNDIRYLLWQSKNQYDKVDVYGDAERVAMRHKWGISITGKKDNPDDEPDGPSGGGGGRHSRREPGIKSQTGMNGNTARTKAAEITPASNTRFRKTDSAGSAAEARNSHVGTPMTAKSMKAAWDELTNSASFMAELAYFDYLLPVKEFQKLATKTSGKKQLDTQDAYTQMLQQSSKNKAEMDLFDSGFVKPLNDAIYAITGRFSKWEDEKADALDLYVQTKHGIERNRDMAVRKRYKELARQEYESQDTEEKKSKEEIFDEKMDAYYNEVDAIKEQGFGEEWGWEKTQRELDHYAYDVCGAERDDYSGFTGNFSKPGMTNNNVLDLYQMAYAYVNKYESGVEDSKLNDLWDAIRSMSAFSMEKQKQSGLVGQKYVDNQSRRFDYYVPLRGFHEPVAQDVYDYIQDDVREMGNPVRMMHGRKSRAGNTFGHLLNIGYRSISSGNRNMALQAFYNLVSSHKTDGLAVVNKTYIKNIGTEEAPDWVVAEPELPVTEDDANRMTPEEVAEVLEKYQGDMKEGIKDGTIMEVRHGKPLPPYRMLGDSQAKVHQIRVQIGGVPKVITIVGNPRVAQALNGQLTPTDDQAPILSRIKNFMSGAFTSYNVSFSAANLVRDTLHANMRAFIEENPRYWAKFSAKQGLMLGNGANWARMMKMLANYNAGVKPRENDYHYKHFCDFMANGGATGYAFIKDQKESMDEIIKGLTAAAIGKAKYANIPGYASKLISFATESSELVNRFIAYETSIEMGRSRTRAISDAKEITLNFNRKGAGTKALTNKEGTKYVMVNALARYSQIGRRNLIFFNAHVQGQYQLLNMFKNHPVKSTTAFVAVPFTVAAMALPFMNNVLLPAIYAAMGGGDDDDDKWGDYYDELTDWERQHNICLRLPKGNGWVKIPITPEVSSFFALGDCAGGKYRGKRDLSAGDAANLIDLVAPNNVNFGSASVAAGSVMPSWFQGLYHVFINKDFKGATLRKETMWNRYDPAYKKVFKNVSPTLVQVSRGMNKLFGGNDYVSAGAMDINPTTIQELLNSLAGGWSSTTIAIADGVYSAMSEDAKKKMRMEEVPVVSRFLISGSSGHLNRRTKSLYYQEVYDFYNSVAAEEKNINAAMDKAEAGNDEMGYAKAQMDIEAFYASDRYKLYEQLGGAVDYIQENLRLYDDEDMPKDVIETMKEAIEMVRE